MKLFEVTYKTDPNTYPPHSYLTVGKDNDDEKIIKTRELDGMYKLPYKITVKEITDVCGYKIHVEDKDHNKKYNYLLSYSFTHTIVKESYSYHESGSGRTQITLDFKIVGPNTIKRAEAILKDQLVATGIITTPLNSSVALYSFSELEE